MAMYLLSLEKETEILRSFNEFIDAKMYLSPSLTIIDAAKQLNTNRQYLSQVINKHFHVNFNQIINKHRVAIAVEIFIKDVDMKYTIESIAFEVGFRNRTSFIQAFKNIYRDTPSKFRKGVLGC